ncbi:dGTP triphosphohydrolase inhibitor [Salmonella phage vB_SAg-RPN15]|uniref:dGTPase inhibitor; target for F exclusion n=1 Tax=Salmonella phage vB_SAg-RPN15 TaxID=2910948 RepID=UPI0023296538|nr:dGTPase inhibitor; target for F exclusion [Salmonella phage vB_SAg-RPN15]UJD21528.1 dGTP triphosphohydrolase inhibitor [Salmonella phage vB_SAg-RPN15]
MMMGRLYSGNLNDFKAATNKLFGLDLAVICDDLYEDNWHIQGLRVSVEDRTGNLIDSRTFFHRDEDVLYIMVTAWLNHMYDQLKDWK